MHPDDDVARNIRNEMQRDAAPSKEEAEADHRRYLSEQGCRVCGETDPDRLGGVQPYIPGCRVIQHPRQMPEPMVFCEEHARPGRTLYEAEQWRKAWDKGATALAFYACGRVRHAVPVDYSDDPDDPNFRHPHNPDRDRGPEVPVTCGCGEKLTEVRFLDREGQ